MLLRLRIDIACRAAHQVSLADGEGRFIWTGRRFRTTPQDLVRLCSMLPEGTDPADVVVVMQLTRNAWVPLAAWFRRHGAEVVLVPPERSADLRRCYSKHSKAIGPLARRLEGFFVVRSLALSAVSPQDVDKRRLTTVSDDR